ncbi:hypothetical protein [Singulisphaera sp. GP187]|uniref:hypothetical protein n=1 Tax=Singulisphaera sp. GP187 TaxID=1882752 RepID=UPI0011613FE1|nr:hypothetical protein [Singulisphaera sp. GP187]
MGTHRKLLVASLVVIHCCVMLCGPSLHSISEIGHPAILGGDTGKSHEDDPFRVPHGFSGHCLVCHLFAQGQMPSLPTIAPSSFQIVVLDRIPFRRVATYILPAIVHPRAPPLQSFGRA